MIIYINIGLIFFCVTAFYLGFSFLSKEKYTRNKFKYVIFLLASSTGLTCGGYAIMSMSTNLNAAFVARDIGLLGIFLYILTELSLVINDIGYSRKTQNIIYFFATIFILSDLIIFGHPDADRFIRHYNYTTFVHNDLFRCRYHIIFLVIMWAFMFSIAIKWATTKKYKRDKHFVAMAFFANYAYLLSSIPTFAGKGIFQKCPYLAFCLGAIIAFLIMYVAALEYSAFFITVNTVSNDMFTNINTGLIVMNADGELNLINKFATELLELDPSNVLGLTLSDLFDMPANKEQSIYNIARQNIPQFYHFDAKTSQKNCRFSITSKMDRSNEPLCYLVVVADLTEENRLIAEANAANETKSLFLSNMSHEIRTPINAITGMNEMILRECTDPSLLYYSKNIDIASHTLLSLVNEILDFSKIESGKMEIFPTDYNISSTISECYRFAVSRAQQKNQNLTLDIDSSIPSILHGDDIKIRQIISNLLSNAIKYTPDNGNITLSIHRQLAPGDMVDLRIRVIDTGIGIKEEDQQQLFQTFTRLDLQRNRTIEGTGLGLAITSNIVQLMHGSISVESVYGEGSTFTVIIPQEVIDSTPIGDIALNQKDLSPVTKHISFLAENASVLVVDDSPMNIDVFCGLLKQSKIKIDTALDGYEALEKINRTHYDILFLDHMMPVMDGIELLHNIKELNDSPSKDSPIIMLTANALIGADKEYKKEGFNDYISKPINPSELEKIIIKYLPEDMVTLLDDTNENVEQAEANKNATLITKLSKYLDVKSGLEFSANDVEFYHALLDTYITEDKRKRMTSTYDEQDWENYRIVVHSLKGTSKTIGANELSEHAKSLEFAARDNDLEYIHAHHQEVLTEYTSLLENLKNL